ncbi:aminoglycoside phosphotransferase family protein [Sideroxydans lithotrophicus]|uniref:Aminoglycoside phosphotransferase n=1 Tax=Sideroxydans lithotrophicus (strain ES-1) TaxID=580332 RepID=D5CTI2_SIDLE|nr:phosphotransferase [Sideroxydans lithotrophicus]ADE10288.1 aminoglycoside phosphotransferase [Sideroxydans lithotrophicus ES-1]
MQRQKQLTDWLSSLYPNETFTIAPASADASFRRYFRATFADGSTKVIMDAPPQHEDCRPFLHVGKLFEEAGTHVPHVHAQDLAQGFLLLSDLGNTTYLQALAADDATRLYGAATDALIKIQLASKEKELPPYDEALLRRELNLFPEWYVARHLGVTLSDKQQAKLEEVFKRILANNLAQPCVYVHRDYHSRNLMYIESPLPNPLPQAGEGANEKGNFQSSPGILDFQDAVYGPITYDLASLFKDAYIHWEEEQIMDWLIRYWEKARKAGLPVREDFGEFYRDYEMMGVQRHIKVLGIFARLYHRDGKDGYLKDMPLVMDYLRRACERYIDLKPLLVLLMELEMHAQQTGASI